MSQDTPGAWIPRVLSDAIGLAPFTRYSLDLVRHQEVGREIVELLSTLDICYNLTNCV